MNCKAPEEGHHLSSFCALCPDVPGFKCAPLAVLWMVVHH